jgi:nitroreductase
MINMDFHEVVLKRRSVRRFKEDKVPENVLDRILEAARWAPSGANLQPWKFIAVTRSETKARIADTCTEYSKEVWKSFTPETARLLSSRGGTWNKSHMKNIPILLAVSYKVTDELTSEIALASTWTAIQNVLLAATNENLAACIYTHANLEEEKNLKNILAVPNAYRLAAIIQLGYPRAIPNAPPRKKLEEIVAYEHF